MDVQLQELIDKIKKDGVGAAEASAQAIIADAEKRAEAIVAEAERKASESEKKAKAEAERLEKASIDAIKQAARNTILSFRDGINAELSALVQSETAKAYDDKLLKTLIPEVVLLAFCFLKKTRQRFQAALLPLLRAKLQKVLKSRLIHLLMQVSEFLQKMVRHSTISLLNQLLRSSRHILIRRQLRL